MKISRRPDKYTRKPPGRGDKLRPPGSGGNAGARGAPPGAFILTVVDGQNQGKEHYFEQQATIGRVEGNDIVLVGPGISREHAAVRNDHGVHLVEDKGSANGTRLNGDPVGAEPEVLRDGDYITLAACTLQFSTLEAVKGEITAERQINTLPEGIDATDEARPGGARGLLRSRKGKLLVVGLVLVVGGLVTWRMLPKGSIKRMFDQSNIPLRYSDDDSFLNAVFGNGEWDNSHRNRVIIHFVYLGGRVTLQYGAWDVDKVGEVAIQLNGEKVGAVPLTLGRWTYGLKLVLPDDKLRKGTNELVFNNTRNPPGRERWEVCYVQLLQEAIPPADIREARHRFELAKTAWDEREVEPGNMYDALLDFRQSRNYMEKIAPRPALYQETMDYIEKINRQLTQRFEEGVFSARRAEKVDADRAKARRALSSALSYFRKGDFRYRKLKDYLNAIAAPSGS